MSVRWPWLYVPFGHVRLSTAVLTGVVLAAVLLRTRRPHVAVVAIMAWLSGFEIIWQTGEYAFGRVPLSYELWFVAAVISWVALAHVLGIRPDPWLTAVFAVTFAVWVALGFHSNWPGQPFSLRDEVLNEVSKTALALAYLLGGVRAGRRRLARPVLAAGS